MSPGWFFSNDWKFALCVFPMIGTFCAAADPAAFERAGTNRPALERAWREVPEAQRRSLGFLLEHMPEADAQTLSADFLLENVALAHAARAAVPWGAQIPDPVFFNDVLPYANATEARDPWRRRFFTDLLPLARTCHSASEAALRLNRTIFTNYGVRYSTRRRRPDQSPAESIGTGLASCTGLSILLVDACRAVGVPARLAGVARWSSIEGNHTWVELWDNGWHFTGAAEPDSRGVDHAWFRPLAAKAVAGDPWRAVMAVSFKRTDMPYRVPWRPHAELWGVDVTRRYTQENAFDGSGIEEVLKRYFIADGDTRRTWEFDPSQQAMLRTHEREVLDCAWRAYRAAMSNSALHEDFAAHRVRTGSNETRMVVDEVGNRLGTGWPVVLGFADAPRIPDSDDVPGYLRVTLDPPAPDNPAIRAALLDSTVKQLLAFSRIDPSRVFLIGPERAGEWIPDRFATTIAAATDTKNPDEDRIRDVYQKSRNPVPHAFAWQPRPGLPPLRNWLQSSGTSKVEASVGMEGFVLRGDAPSGLRLLADRRLVEYDKPVRVTVGDRLLTCTFRPDLKVVAETLLLRGDPELAFVAAVELSPEE